MGILQMFSKSSNLFTCGKLFANTSFNIPASSLPLLPFIQTQYLLCSKNVSPSDKKEKLKLPEKPKRPLTPFFRFISDRRHSIITTHPELKLPDVVKKCSEEWKNTDATVKHAYQESYKKDMERYAKIYSEYVSKLTDEQKLAIKETAVEKRRSLRKRQLRKKIRESNKPKRPLQPYILFVKEQQTARNLKVPEFARILSSEWKALSDSDKAKYRETYEREKSAFDKKLKEWENEMIKEGKTELVRKSTISKLDISQRKQIEKTMQEKNQHKTKYKKPKK